MKQFCRVCMNCFFFRSVSVYFSMDQKKNRNRYLQLTQLPESCSANNRDRMSCEHKIWEYTVNRVKQLPNNMSQRVCYTFDIYLFRKMHLERDPARSERTYISLSKLSICIWLRYTRVFQERPNTNLK